MTLDLASRFRIEDQRITQFARYDSLDTGLDEANLNYSDEINQMDPTS